MSTGALTFGHLLAEVQFRLNAVVDRLKLNQLKDLAWFGNSLSSDELILRNVKLDFEAYDIKVFNNDKQCYGNIYPGKISKVSIRPLNKSAYQAVIKKNQQNPIEINYIDVKAQSIVNIEFERNPIKMHFGIVKGLMKGFLNMEGAEFYLEIQSAVIKVDGKALECNRLLKIIGKTPPARPRIEFSTQTSGRITFLNPHPREDTSFHETMNTTGATNNIEIKISDIHKDDHDNNDSYYQFAPVKNNKITVNQKIYSGDKVKLSSENNFDINRLTFFPDGVHISLHGRGRKIRIDDVVLSPNVIDNISRSWSIFVALVIFLVKDVLLAIAINRVEKNSS